MNAPPDRKYAPNIRNFQPSQNYRPKKGRKNQSQKRKRSDEHEIAENPSKEKSILRDVVLLPSPCISDVPRGSKREELYTNGCVISAFNISDGLSENEIRCRMVNAFGEKLNGLPDPKFHFVRAVGNKIIDPACDTYSGKVLKYLNKQGPIYIRAVSEIKNLTNMDDLSDESSNENEDTLKMDSDDDVLLVSAFDFPVHSSTTRNDSNQSSSIPSHVSGSTVTGSINPAESSNSLEIRCPTCFKGFSVTEISQHADLCAEEADGFSASRLEYGNLLMEFPCDEIESQHVTTSVTTSEPQENLGKTLQECLDVLKRNVNEEKTSIFVRRKLLWEDYVSANKRNKWFNPANNLKVNFIGEAAVDGGGPRREFFCEALKQMEIRLFCGGVPVQSTVSLTEGYFKLAGYLMASSILQGGPAPNFLAKWVYEYISGGLDAVKVHIEDVTTYSIKGIVTRISTANSDKELQDILLEDHVLSLLDRIGYRRIPTQESLENKENLVRCICLNDAVVPKIPMLKDLEEGLQLYGLSQLIKQNSEVLEPVFTQSDKFNITADNFLEKLIVHYSQQQLYKSKEEDVFKFFADFVQALFYEGIHEAPDLELKHLLKFATGCETIPPLGFPSDLNIHFRHGCPSKCKCRPTASTCGLILTLPIHSCCSKELGDLLISALNECCGFGNV